jgi:hypothetical protein
MIPLWSLTKIVICGSWLLTVLNIDLLVAVFWIAKQGILEHIGHYIGGPFVGGGCSHDPSLEFD